MIMKLVPVASQVSEKHLWKIAQHRYLKKMGRSMNTSGGGLERIKKLVRDQPQPLEILQITQQLPC